MIFVSRLIRFGVSPVSGILYSRDILENMLHKWTITKDTIPTFGIFNDGSHMSEYLELDKICSKIVKMELDDEGLVVYQEILETPNGNVLKNLLELDSKAASDGGEMMIQVSPNMMGIVENKVAMDMQLVSVSFGLKTDSLTNTTFDPDNQ